MADRRESQLGDDFVRHDLEQMARAGNYLEYQFRMFEPFLGRRILEVGTGIGNFTGRLLPKVELLVGLEPNEFCFAEINKRLGGNESLILLHGTLEDCSLFELEAHRLDTVLCVNVLEHIEDDLAALRSFQRVLCPEGRLVLVVPSPAWAYGVIDKAVGHFRRYSGKSLTALVENAGFKVNCRRYFNPIGLAGWLWNAKVSKRVRQSDTQIYFFDRFIVPLQNFVEKRVKLPIGQSLLLVAEKR